ncbi:heme o synthase [Alteribacter natronophilus]|uniref:heme o synthase n=1 Tax=Alteribacter natronophilus TaxID=2583810 RepID=UPI00110D4FC3|nr:heme o synthase [Alteribacter natronophilus]TMW73086.1 protoheme IX farnesyltransferase [Alteribacter natronophilus]
MNKSGALSSTDVISEEQQHAQAKKATWRSYMDISKTGIVKSNLITMFAGLFLAAHYTQTPLSSAPHIVILSMLGAALIIAGGCALNNYVDRDIDDKMIRTDNRPSVTGELTGSQVLWYGLITSAVGTLLLASVNLTTAVIGLSGLVIYVVFYTMWTKRTTTLNTIVGSFAGAVPPLIGWAAIDPGLHPYAWSLFLILFIWQTPHFLALAMRRCEEYRAAGIPMLPVVAGFGVTKRQILFYTAALLPVSLTLFNFGAVYTVTAFVLGAGWLVLGFAGYKKYDDDIKWATHMFLYSLVYLMVLFAVMVIVHMF